MVRYWHRLSKRQLEIAFGLFLLLVAARFVISLFYGSLYPLGSVVLVDMGDA